MTAAFGKWVRPDGPHRRHCPPTHPPSCLLLRSQRRLGLVPLQHMGMFKKEYLPTSRGFNYSSGMLSGASDHYTHMVDGAYDWHRMEQPNFEADGRYAGNLVRDDALSFLAQVSGGVEPQPFFLYLPFQVRARNTRAQPASSSRRVCAPCAAGSAPTTCVRRRPD
eukprot:COSAG01_NODE_3025_length_6708_cov_3.364352_3_plen_165_part_00